MVFDMLELETKIIDFDEDETREKLNSSSAKFQGVFLYKRWVFDLSKSSNKDEFIRIRTDGKKSTLAYKFRKGQNLSNTEELEVSIDDFETTARIISKLVNDGVYQENKTEKWAYGEVEITINKWPKIPPVIEVEGKSEKLIMNAIKELQIIGRDVGNLGWNDVYKIYGLDLNSFHVLKFK